VAATITGTKQLEIYNVTNSATPGNVTLLNLPGKIAILTVQARTNDSKLVVSSTLGDTDAIGAAAYFTLTAGSALVFDVSGMNGQIFLASATASAVVEIAWSSAQ
jgi:hypothetical protein